MTSLVIRRFADRLTTLAGRTGEPDQLATAAGRLLGQVLGLERVLDPGEQEPDPHRYRQHILHVDPAGRFSIVALVWLPGQETPIHDHVAWCVTGVLTGSELEQHFEPTPGISQPGALRLRGAHLNEPGTISALPPGQDIHRVCCTGGDKTISLHIYGADLSRVGSSINLTYDPRSVLLPS